MIGLRTGTNALNVAVIGAGGGIGKALVEALANREGVQTVHALSRAPSDHDSPKVRPGRIDITDEASVIEAAGAIDEHLDLVIVATGILHAGDIQPERRIKEVDVDAMHAVFAVNTVGPVIAAKHFLPKLRKSGPSVFAAISARVGSITDNRLGGWTSYRASKAALNMVLKTFAIEHARGRRESVIAALHPGTVDTQLSEPFSKRVPDGKLFEPSRSAAYLLDVIEGLRPEDSGGFFAWDGSRIDY